LVSRSDRRKAAGAHGVPKNFVNALGLMQRLPRLVSSHHPEAPVAVNEEAYVGG
jgi:hypothetical protein